MERWPWPKNTQNWLKNELNPNLEAKNGAQCPCETLRNSGKNQPQTAVKLILWPSNDNESGTVVDGGLGVSKPPRKLNKKMWSKLPLRQIPSSLTAKMGWLSNSATSSGGQNQSEAGQNHASAVKQTNAVFRSNSFR